MRLIEVYQTIQLVIAKEMLNVLRYDGEETLKEWIEKHEEDSEKLNSIVLTVLANNRKSILDALTSEYAEAEQLITEHIEAEWGFDDIEIDSSAYEDATAQFLNENIVHGLLSVNGQVGTVERAYQSILKQAQEAEIKSSDDVLTTVGLIIYEELKDGFYSGFIQSDGLQWRMDRYVQQISKHIYHDTYDRALKATLYRKGVELVRVEKFVKPRVACAELQASGIICIVPRNQASDEALEYPNIWDEEHKYGEMGGHHGADGNCRHIWHSVESEEVRTKKLYDVIDKNVMRLEIQRLLFNKMLRKYL